VLQTDQQRVSARIQKLEQGKDRAEPMQEPVNLPAMLVACREPSRGSPVVLVASRGSPVLHSDVQVACRKLPVFHSDVQVA
jgi:hypothetical protein